MGWLKLGARKTVQQHSLAREITSDPDLKSSIEHVEYSSNPPRRYQFVPLSLPNAELPFISPEEVKSFTSASSGGLFIVVDNIVYNCSFFLSEHPGGEDIIKSFAGAECSWQFWRFHGKKEMEGSGKALRVGRTKGMVNKYKEPVRFVGLRRLGDDWD